jgi:hypothetical protein
MSCRTQTWQVLFKAGISQKDWLAPILKVVNPIPRYYEG